MIPPVAKDSTYHKSSTKQMLIEAHHLEHVNIHRCVFDFVAKQQNGAGHVLHDSDTNAIPVDLIWRHTVNIDIQSCQVLACEWVQRSSLLLCLIRLSSQRSACQR